MYEPTLWKDHVDGVQEGTDLNADNLNNMEKGAMEAAALAAFLAYNSSVGGNVPFSESKQSGGGYCREVTVALPNGGVLSEKEWLVKPDTNTHSECRTTGRFAGFPIYEQERFSFTPTPGELWFGSVTYGMSFDNNKTNAGLRPFVVEVVGSYSGFEKKKWMPINDGVVSAEVSMSEANSASVEITDVEGNFPYHAITVRYIYVNNSDEEEE